MKDLSFGPIWGHDEQDFLILHWNKPGWSPERIAAEKPGIRRTVPACQQRAYYLGLTERENSWSRKYGHLYPLVQALAYQDLTRDEICDEIERRHQVRPSGKWVTDTLEKHYPQTYKMWMSRAKSRRARGVSEGKRRKKK